MIRYATAHGVPASSGATQLEPDGTASCDDRGRRRARDSDDRAVELAKPGRATGQLRYLTRVDGQLVSGRYPFVMDAAETFEVESVGFWGPARVVAGVAPGRPAAGDLRVLPPSISFCYPGGEGPLGRSMGRSAGTGGRSPRRSGRRSSRRATVAARWSRSGCGSST
jgi:hypothetical protein